MTEQEWIEVNHLFDAIKASTEEPKFYANWICSCGHENKNRSPYCSRCGMSINAVKPHKYDVITLES